MWSWSWSWRDKIALWRLISQASCHEYVVLRLYHPHKCCIFNIRNCFLPKTQEREMKKPFNMENRKISDFSNWMKPWFTGVRNFLRHRRLSFQGWLDIEKESSFTRVRSQWKIHLLCHGISIGKWIKIHSVVFSDI